MVLTFGPFLVQEWSLSFDLLVQEWPLSFDLLVQEWP